MARNETGQDVPLEVEQAALEASCLGGIQYVYEDGNYGGRCPVASIGCRASRRFKSKNYENFKVALPNGWVAFKSPSYNAAMSSDQPSVPQRVSIDETLGALLRLTDPEAYSPGDDEWVRQAVLPVEQAIDALIREFAHLPYLHRVEHSLHIRLCSLIRDHASGYLLDQFQIGDGLGVTQLVHKEWPETFARPEKKGRRGNFDVVVLSPQLLATCPTLEDFRQGRLAAPFVIEVGVDYNVHHLARDVRKLLNSRPYRGYVLHLTRGVPRDGDVEQIIANLEQRTGVRTGYVCVDEDRSAHKLVTATTITPGLP